MGRRRTRVALGAALAAALGFALGPRPAFEERWRTVVHADDWDEGIARAEASVPGLRPGDHKEVVWLDPATEARTPLALVYLHGFSADRHEVEPLVTRLAGALGANVFFSRLTGHGRDGSAMAEASVELWLDDAAAAYQHGLMLGERVVLVGTSTGGTLATWVATRDEVEEGLAALVLLSPNFHPRGRAARVLLWPWGAALARVVTGPERCFEPENEEQEAHWTTCYPTSALLPMMALVEHVRTMELGTVEAPTLVLYSPDDRVVDARETERVVERLTNAPVALAPFPDSGDPAGHVLAGDILSPGSTEAVADVVLAFLAPFAGGAAARDPASGDGRDDPGARAR